MTVENHTFDPFSEASPWEVASREAEAERDAKAARMAAKEAEAAEVPDKPARAAGGRTEDSGANWDDLTKRPMDWQRRMICLDISTPAKILGVAMSHYCGPNSHGCSASIDTLAEKAGLSRRAADRAIKALREHDLIRDVGTGYNWVKVYHLGIPK